VLHPGSQIICNATDLAYAFRQGPPTASPYYGEINFQHEYKGLKSGCIEWTFIDRYTFIRIAVEEGWKTEILAEADKNQYLLSCRPG
jgi:hypothetical protein